MKLYSGQLKCQHCNCDLVWKHHDIECGEMIVYHINKNSKEKNANVLQWQKNYSSGTYNAVILCNVCGFKNNITGNL